MNLHLKNAATLMGLMIFLLSYSDAIADTDAPGAGNILYTSAPNPVGSGARALGMGGAFISIADDATAASWNPAGLVQLKRPELSIVGSFVSRREGFDSDPEYGALEDENINTNDLNYLSVVLPFAFLHRNMAISLNYQHLYDYASKGKLSDDIVSIRRNVRGSLSPIGIAYSLQITPKLKWGVTFNFWNKFFDDNQLKEIYQMRGAYDVSVKKTHEINGFNFITGLLWHAFEKTGIGVVFKSPFTADIHAQTETIAMGMKLNDETFETDKKLKMPLSFGIGGHYKLNDFFKLSIDVFQTNWNEYDYLDSNGDRYSAATGLLKNEARVHPTRQIRAGMEYIVVKPDTYRTYPMRIGLFYDPIPDKGSPVDAYGGSVGTGVSTSRFAIDGFYQYKFSTNHSSMNTFKEFFPEKIKEHQIYLSLIYYI